ncbi:cell division protein ZipA [Microbulbifer aggregans]|uniref:cell division protein ZipA n=1 Tax=Microbulbifer aggregans TaxID=1769779 RepID=UPI001CFD410C|nr:cell division protein ZipA [Microbulbifer aggregans]
MDNWLINLLALLLFAVVVDGARRAYLKHRDTVKVSRNLSRAMRRDMDEREYEDLDRDVLSSPRKVEAAAEASRKQPIVDDSELEYIDPEEAEKRRQISAELPGTVRVVQRRKPEDASQVNRQVQQNFQSSRKPLAGSKPERSAVDESGENRVPEQASLNLDEQVPMLMDSVAEETGAESREEFVSAFNEPAVSSQQVASEVNVGDVTGYESEMGATRAQQRLEPSLDESVSLETLQAVDPEERGAVEQSDQPPQNVQAQSKAGWNAVDLKFPELKKASPFARSKDKGQSADGRAGSRKNSSRQKSTEARRELPVEEVLILNIMAPQGDCFEGNDLLRVLLSSGLRFGEMNIFHYHCGEAGEGPALFSLANIVVPGTFDMSQMEDFVTPGVSLFLTLPAEVEALKALDTLLTVARNIAEQLGGELKDENRSVFTGQTAEHYRQRVMEFQRRKALAQAQA